MNADHIYQLQRDEAFALQFSDTHYRTFLAMPFGKRGGYPQQRIRKLFAKVHTQANRLLGAAKGARSFAPLERVDDMSAGAIVITDEIVRGILTCHFFVSDLTGGNTGVILETGIALALKPNARVILCTQDGADSLHFDLKVTNVIPYDETTLIERLARELVKAAKAFERESDRYVKFVSAHLTVGAIRALNCYGRLWKGWKSGMNQPSIHEVPAAHLDPQQFGGADGKMALRDALRELGEKRLMWTHYSPNKPVGSDSWGTHATELGWRVIEHLWKHDRRMRKPAGAPTGPNV